MDERKKTKLSEALSETSGYEEFKYIMQDTGSYYVGAKYTYGELMNNDVVPFKFKAIIEHYFMKDTDITTSLESQLYYIDKEQFSYKTYNQLKARVKVSLLVPRKKLFSKKVNYVYEEKILNLEELAEMNLARKKGSGLIIRELVISKLALMGFSV